MQIIKIQLKRQKEESLFLDLKERRKKIKKNLFKKETLYKKILQIHLY